MLSRLGFAPVGLLLLSLLVVACGSDHQSDGGSGPQIEGDNQSPEYVESSCRYRFDQGESTSVILPQSHIVSASFGKTFDRSRLLKVGKTSAQKIAEIMRLDGVIAYHIPVSAGKACPMLSGLPQAPSAVKSYWDDLSSSKTLGVYLPVNRVRSLGETGPIVILRADTDRYSLIHEYMHHVFSHLHEQTGMTDERFLREYSTRSQIVRNLSLPKENSTKEEVRFFGESWANMLDSVFEMLVSFPLEEIAIEVEISQAIQRDEVNRVTPFNQANSRAYVSSSYVKAKDQLNDVRNVIYGIQAILRKHSLKDLESRYYRLLSRAVTMKDEASRLNGSYGRDILSSVDLSTNLSAHETHTHGDFHRGPASEGCSHSQSFDVEMKKRGLRPLNLRTVIEQL